MFGIGVITFIVVFALASAVGSFDQIPGLQGKQAGAGAMVVGFFTAYLSVVFLGYPYVAARIQNLVWNHTQLGNHRFASNARARDLLMIMLGNIGLIVLTLGFYKPYADLRMVRYRLEHLTLLPDSNLDQFIAGQMSNTSAAGEEIAEMFDFDIAL